MALLGAFVGLGVEDVVLSPGSRSQALALACAEFERIGRIRLHVRIDERSAGFLALGLAIESGVPALMITTSGTAVANLHPAVLEAHHSGIPLILLTADRPNELRGIRSNQTTTQRDIFGVATRLCIDVAAPRGADEPGIAAGLARQATDAAAGVLSLDPGPVQLNLAFREPLSAVVPESAFEPVETRSPAVEPAVTGSPALELCGTVVIAPGRRTVVIAGHGAGPAAEELARAGGWPLLAEVSSGSRFGPNLVVTYRELLGDADFGGRVERAIVFGHPTLSREVPALIQKPGVETTVVSATGSEWYNPGLRVETFARAVTMDERSVAAASREGREWLGRWVMASRNLLAEEVQRESTPISPRGISRAELAAMRAPVTRAILVGAVWRASWPHDRLVFGASRLIREADARVPGKKIPVHANRGLAGIDGTIATAMGIALASQTGVSAALTIGLSAGSTRLLLGDLALLHDVGSLLIPPGEPRPRLQVIVGNDGGGTIFDSLEVRATAPRAAMDRVLFTPQEVDLSALAAAYGWEYGRAETRSELERALTTPPAGPSILEIPLAR